jgi:hypothetical protein
MCINVSFSSADNQFPYAPRVSLMIVESKTERKLEKVFDHPFPLLHVITETNHYLVRHKIIFRQVIEPKDCIPDNNLVFLAISLRRRKEEKFSTVDLQFFYHSFPPLVLGSLREQLP